jgi:uncharacterized protein DUF6930
MPLRYTLLEGELMPRRVANAAATIPDQFFTDELVGETPPSHSTMQRLYDVALELITLQPWHVLDETELVLTRDSATGQTCYCSAMGALGEVLMVQAYIGAEGYRLFRRVEAGEVSGAGDFYEAQHSVYMEFVPREELDAQDRKLLRALGHPAAVKAAPVFRACRPGYFPWYVTEQEARMLEECLRAVIVTCHAVINQDGKTLWQRPYTYPMVSLLDEKEGRYRIELVEATLPKEPPLAKVQLGPDELRRLLKQDYAIRGVLELDHFSSGAQLGNKNQRKGYVGVAMAVDSETGLVFPPEMVAPGDSIANALGRAILRASEVSRAFPQEVRVSKRSYKDCLEPVSELCGFPVNVVRSLPALAQARESMLRMMSGRI